MLKLLDNNDLSEIQSICKNSIIGTKISCYALAYGFDKDFLTFWGDRTAQGLITVVTKFDNSMTVLTTDKTDLEELKEFISVIGSDDVLIDEATAKRMNFNDFNVKKGFIYNSDTDSNFTTQKPSEEDYRDIYSLISSEIPDSFINTKEAYLSFLSDFTYRANRGYARAECIKKDGKVVACSLTGAQSDCAALLSGIACSSKYRSCGFGKQVVLSLTQDFIKENKNVYVIALNEAAEGFYKHIGFIECEKIAFIKRKVQYV